MNLKEIQSIYFIGIGGIGMSALAKYFHLNGKIVSGYDKFPSPLTTEMMSAGIAIHFEEDIATIPKDADLVVYTPAVPSDHQELLYYQNHNYKVIKRADLLEAVTKKCLHHCRSRNAWQNYHGMYGCAYPQILRVRLYGIFGRDCD